MRLAWISQKGGDVAINATAVLVVREEVSYSYRLVDDAPWWEETPYLSVTLAGKEEPVHLFDVGLKQVLKKLLDA